MTSEPIGPRGIVAGRRAGVTLLELLVCLALLALVAAIVAPTVRSLTHVQPADDPVRAACREASVTARTVTVRVVRRDTLVSVACYPGGEVSRTVTGPERS